MTDSSGRRRLRPAKPTLPETPKKFRLGRGQTEKERKRKVDRRRQWRASRRWYSTARWKKRKAEQLEREPYCCDCAAEGRQVNATHADHDPPHNEDEWLFFHGPLKSRCQTHHNRKTAAKDGGFGNPKGGKKRWGDVY